MSCPRFSVIIPLEDDRGHAVRCVRAWAEQRFARDEFEIVIASPTGYAHAELDEIRRLLGPHDQVLELDRHHDMDLCAMGAKRANGELLFFTESHCMPEPETLARADSVAREHTEWAGFSGRSIPVTGNLLSEIEAEWYGPAIESGMEEHPWRKVLDQCFVVHRSAYFQAGGFDPTFGHFAEWVIAARLSALGLKIGYEPSVRIHHLYIGEYGEWRRFTANFVHGQMAFLAQEPSDPLTTMFDEVGEWSRRHMLRRSVARRLCRMLLSDLRRSALTISSLRHWHWRLLGSWLLRAAGGASIVQMRAQRKFLTNRVALQVDLVTRSRTRARSHFVRCCEAIITVEHTRFLRTWARGVEPVDPAPSDSGVWEPGRLDEFHGVGFHLAEVAGGETIRWSEPAAYVELPLAAGRYVLRLNWLFAPLVDGESRVRFFLDERPIPSQDVSIGRDFVELRVTVPEPSSRPRLGWVCPAVRAGGEHGDNRALGLPVVSLTWAPDDGSASRLDVRAAEEVELVHLA